MSQLTDQPKRQRKSHVSLSAVSLESESTKLGPPAVSQFPGKHTTYVYVNTAYDGLGSVSDVRGDVRTQLPPPTRFVTSLCFHVNGYDCGLFHSRAADNGTANLFNLTEQRDLGTYLSSSSA